jgi:hypothetical protein
MLRRATLPALAVMLAALLVSACSQQSGLDLAREACSHVHASIRAFDAALHAKSRAEAERDLNTATNDLQTAEPLAAQATSADGQWNALMTTLNELGQVDEGHLLVALRAQCAVADSNQPELPNLPTTFPPVPTSGRGQQTSTP